MKYSTQISMRRLEPLDKSRTGRRAWLVTWVVNFQSLARLHPTQSHEH